MNTNAAGNDVTSNGGGNASTAPAVTKENISQFNYYELFRLPLFTSLADIVGGAPGAGEAGDGALPSSSSSTTGGGNDVSRQVKKLYRKYCLLFHPDKDGSPAAQLAFETVTTAVDTLTDGAKKRSYDAALQARLFPHTATTATAATAAGGGSSHATSAPDSAAEAQRQRREEADFAEFILRQREETRRRREAGAAARAAQEEAARANMIRELFAAPDDDDDPETTGNTARGDRNGSSFSSSSSLRRRRQDFRRYEEMLVRENDVDADMIAVKEKEIAQLLRKIEELSLPPTAAVTATATATAGVKRPRDE